MDNRLIKFRGKVGGVWWYATPDDPWWSTFWTLADRNTIGQFTGLHAKYRREVYADDIIKGNNAWDTEGDALQVVRYEDGTWNYSSALHEYAEHPERDWEVVGNTHDTPELLSKEGAA